MPISITHSAGAARPNGASTAAITPAGITATPITGTASILAISP